MRILQVNNVRWFNACSWYALTLSRLLADAGHQVRVLTLAGTDSEAKARAMGLDTVTLPLNSADPLSVARSWAGLRRMLVQFRPQVINCHRGEGFALFGLLRALNHDFALARTRGDQRPPKNNPPNRVLHARVADAVITTNRVMAARLRGLSVDEERLATILGGVDTKAFTFDPAGRARVRAELDYTSTDTVLGIVGRLDPVKGHASLIRAVSLLRAHPGLDNVKLLCVGFDQNVTAADLLAEAEQAGVADAVTITGQRDDVAACMAAMDVGVVASLGSEAIARAALELMACGRPLLGSHVGVMPDLLAAHALFPPGNTDAMAALLTRAVTNAGFRETLCTEQAAVLTGCTLDAFRTRTEAVYARAVERLTAGPNRAARP